MRLMQVKVRFFNGYLFIYGPLASNTHKLGLGRGQRLVFAGLSFASPPILPPIYFPCSWPEARQGEKIQQEFGLWKPVFLLARLSLLYTTDTVFVNQSCLC